MPDAKKDIDDIWTYVALNDLPEKADALYDVIEKKCNSLSYIAERGRRVYELEDLNIFNFHEIIHSPYRIVYQIFNSRVVIYGVFDGRRELKELLLRRISNNTTSCLL